jgi:hypothetical protein
MRTMQRRDRRMTCGSAGRTGSLVPLVAIALLVVMGALALVLDRLWIDNAQVELDTAVELAAVAAAQELVSDDLLRGSDAERRLNRARLSAARVAVANRVVGRPVWLDLQPGHDVLFGRHVRDDRTGQRRFLETANGPTTVLVRTLKTRDRNNPVALLLRGLDGTSTANLAARCEVSLDNRVVAFRPLPNVPVPLLPIAIRADRFRLASTVSDEDAAADPESGMADRLSFHAESQEIVQQPDGLLELTVRGRGPGIRPEDADLVLLEFGNSLYSGEIDRQIHSGLREVDLTEFDGQLRVDRDAPQLSGTRHVSSDLQSSFEDILGQPRLMLVYDDFDVADGSGAGYVVGIHVVAGRVMAVRSGGSHGLTLTIQPCVMTTRTAVLKSEEASSTKDRNDADWFELASHAGEPAGSRHVYKLQKTR